MKLISFVHDDRERTGFISGDQVIDIQNLDTAIPCLMNDILADWENYYPALLKHAEMYRLREDKKHGLALTDVRLLAPVPHPGSLRDGYAFRQHVETARRNRGMNMTPVFDSYPVFYFGNQSTVQGPGPVYGMPDHFKKLDFELEAAVVISKKGKNIRAADADLFIAGLMILNDFSARTLQMEEMALSLGPAKGKDFATSTGPWLVTPEELEPFEVPCKQNHQGKAWNLDMTASVNGLTISRGNLSEMEWTFAELIERASYGATLYPGDIIGSGTVGTGCFLELNGTARLKDPGVEETWLNPGDRVALTVTALGTLENQVLSDSDVYSILELKK